MSSYRNVEAYDILRARSRHEIRSQVQALLENGWQPLGGVVVTLDQHTQVETYYQTVVRRDLKKDKT